MKKYTLLLALMSVLPGVSYGAYDYNQYENGYRSATSNKSSSYKTTTTSRKTGGYRNVIMNNFYYAQPANGARKSYYDDNYTVSNRQNATNSSYLDSGNTVASKKKSVTKTYSSQERKFFLAHPFFQPLQGKIGSVTDFGYAHNNFKFDMLDGYVKGLNPEHDWIYGPLNPILSGKTETNQFFVKEDISFGLSDTLAVIGMVQYDSTKISFKDWSDGTPGDSYSDSGLNIFGIGLQNRFVDNNDWIAMVSGYFQHQKDTANTFIGEMKVGYKINRTTVYGLGRAGYSNLTKGDTYGAYVEDGTGDYLMLTYKTDVKDVVYVEGGLGAFAVLNKYFTLNGEATYGHYDWHSQFNIKGAIGWQPGDMFALNLYASTSLYDSAKGKTNKYISYDVNPNGYPTDAAHNPLYTDSTILFTTGDYKINTYNEWKVGVQAILYF